MLLPFTLQIERDSLVLFTSYQAILMKRFIFYQKVSKALVNYLYLSSLPTHSFLPTSLLLPYMKVVSSKLDIMNTYIKYVALVLH